jgi:hypothetical protein
MTSASVRSQQGEGCAKSDVAFELVVPRALLGRLALCYSTAEASCMLTKLRGVSEVGSSLLATGYQQVRSVVAALAGTGPAPPNATRGRRPRPCPPPTETCSPSPAAANSPRPSPSAHRYGGGRQRGGVEHTGPCQASTSRPASATPTRTQTDQPGHTVNISRPAASDCQWLWGRSRSPWRPPAIEMVVVLPPAAEVLGVLVDGVPVGPLGPGRLGHRLPPPARLVSTRSRSASST